MADTLPNIVISGGVWIDIYAASGIPVGSKLVIENTGTCDVYLAVQATQPPVTHREYNILKRTGDKLSNNAGDAGAWAFCGNCVGEINVSVETANGFNAVGANTSGATRLSDRQGKTAKISMKGELLVGSNVDDVDINFQYIVRTAETFKTETGTGTVTHPGVVGSYAQLSPGSGVGRASLYSKAPVRYRGGHEAYCELSWIFRTPEAANWKDFCGFFNTADRLMVGYKNLDFGVLFTEGGNETFVKIGDDSTYGTTEDPLDGTGPSGYVINPHAINVYRLSFVWHGGLPLSLEIQVGKQWWPVFTFDFSNSITETHLENPHLPIGGFIERTSGTGSASASKTGSWRGGSISAPVGEPSDDWTGWTVLDVTLVNNARTNILTLVNPTTWQGKSNHVVYTLGVVTFRSSANKDLALYGTKGATLTGAGAATNIDVANYALQYRTGGTVTLGQRGSAATILGAGERERIDTRGTGIKVYPGEAFTIEADAGGAVNGSFSCATRFIHEG